MECIRARFGRMLLAIALAGLFSAADVMAQATGAQQDEESQPAPAAAEQVMHTLSDGLTGNSARNFLSAFDPDQMPDYSNFAGQVRMFFSIYDNFRVHYQIVEVRAKSDRSASVTANVELDGDNANSDVPGPNRAGQLNLQISQGKGGWKITDLQPREFFR